ncbi:MAG TPA: HD domain-containing phosphohydrolase [bacterium]|nr:HD domain-containing phosphohydrolase [bacterium]HPS30754.1 HD domain-containing phosphohydrolase [bacterium]
MTISVLIPAQLRISRLPQTELTVYENKKDLIRKSTGTGSSYILIIYEDDYKESFAPVKNSEYTIIVSFGCKFEMLSQSLMRIDGEKLTSFSLECIIELLKVNTALNRRMIDNMQIGISLTVEKDPNNLYSSILTFLRRATGAEAGTLYLMSKERDKIYFISSQNAKFDSKMIEKREVPFNRESFVGFVCHSGKTLNIENAYEIPEDAPYHFNDAIDKKLNYKTVSIITVPMKTAADEVVGAVQLINKLEKNNSDAPVPFSKFDEMMLTSLSTLAAVTVENNNLLLETETLLNNMIISSVKAIEQRDPATKGHSLRVAAYTIELLKRMEKKYGKSRGWAFDSSALKTAETAALLHDFGKVGVREKILMKHSRIYPEQLEALKWKMKFIIASVNQHEESDKVAHIKQLLDKIDDLNVPKPHTDDEKNLINEVAGYTFVIGNEVVKVLNDEELGFLNIKSGTLNAEERSDMERHVLYSYELLRIIDWPYDLKNVPMIASSHHEKLDGTGYPHGKNAKSLGNIERVLAVADIFDALTAKDRPYKKAIPPEIALGIIRKEVDAGKLDPDVFDLLVTQREEIETEVRNKVARNKFNK